MEAAVGAAEATVAAGGCGDGGLGRDDRLDYLIDLIMQLRDLAQDGGLQRLALILMLAEQEARQQLGRPLRQPDSA